MILSGEIEKFKIRNEFIESRKSDECGCPEEDWIIGMLFVTIHIEPDGSGHIFIDCGDWEKEKLVPTNGIEELRLEAETWASSFPIEN
jgi:hypothetical protein